MSQELQLRKYEFIPDDRRLLVELLHEIRELRLELNRANAVSDPSEEELEEGYRQMAKAEAADPHYFDLVEN